MKTKIFMTALAIMAIVGCNKEIDNGQLDQATGETSFLQVNLKAAGTMTKADAEAKFEYGLDTENAVKSVTFYFFTDNGAPYVVQNQENYISGNITDWNAGAVNNIEEISGLTLVIKQHQSGELPAKMVAVLNAPTELKKSMSLTDLAESLIQHTNTDGFVMSNSVYVDVDDEAVINATEITAENLFTANLEEGDPGYNAPGVILDPTKYSAAAVNPVDIYVERVAVKVRVSGVAELLPVYAEDGTTQLVDAENNKVYAKVLGWDVTNNTANSYALKQLSATYNDLGFDPWNNAAFFRSYWANTTVEPLHNITFAALKDGKNLNPGYAYYNENTAAYNAEGNGVDVDDSNGYTNDDGVASTANQAPQLLVAAQLVKADGTPIQLAKWYGDLYTIEGLQAAMVKTVAHRIYVVDSTTENADGTTSTTYRSIEPGDVTFYQVAQTTEDKRYEVKIKATDDVEYYDMNGTAYETAEDVNEILGAITPAQMWYNGYTYYYKDIAHFGSSYGMVRNHIYDIKVTSVSGFGTPVYNDSFVITPEPTEDETASNLAAQINILSWHVVSQDIVLGN